MNISLLYYSLLFLILNFVIICCEDNIINLYLVHNQYRIISLSDYYFEGNITSNFPCCFSYDETSKVIIGYPNSFDSFNFYVYNDQSKTIKYEFKIEIYEEIHIFYYFYDEIIIPYNESIRILPEIDVNDANFTISENDFVDFNVNTGEIFIENKGKNINEKMINITAKNKVSEMTYSIIISLTDGYLLGSEYIYQLFNQVIRCPPGAMISFENIKGVTNENIDFLNDEDKFLAIFNKYKQFILNIYGYIKVEEKDIYNFFTYTSYVTQLTIDNNLILDTTGICNDSIVFTNSTYLDVGYHKFDMYTYGTIENFKPFDFTYSIGSSIDESHFFSYMKVDFSLSYFNFENEHYFIGFNSYISIKFNVTNVVNCKSKPNLPLDLNIIPGEIYGVVRSIDYGRYYITCYNYYSIPKPFGVELLFFHDYSKYVMVYYYKSSNFSNENIKVISSSLIKKIVQIENGINRPYNYDQNVWPGLTNDFSSEYFVSYEGYMHLEKTGIYTLLISVKDECYIEVNYKLIGTVSGSDDFYGTTRTFNADYIGYYFFKLNLMVYRGGSGITISIKKPDDNKYEEIEFYNSIFIIF